MFQKTKYYPVNVNTKEIVDMPFKRERNVFMMFKGTGFIGIKGQRLNEYKCYTNFIVIAQPLYFGGTMPEKEVILYDSDKAARYVTGIKGWVDRNNRFYGDNKDSEHIARYSGCTHRICECGNLMEKHYTKCAICRKKAAVERHKQRERKEWDEARPVYSEDCDRYFYSWEDIEDYLMDCEPCSKEDLRLIICEPVYLTQIDTDYWEIDLPEDGEVPDEVVAALDKLNHVIEQAGPVAWKPGKYAVDL